MTRRPIPFVYLTLPLGLYASLGLGLVAACGHAATSSPATVPVPTQQSASAAQRESEVATEHPAPGQPFGGSVYGFVEYSSDNGRIVLVRRFPGDERPQFGHHGSSSVPDELVAFDLVEGTERVIDNWVEFANGRRFVLLVDERQLWLVDANGGSWEALPNADVEDDGNRCLGPRGGGFSPDGTRVAWVQDGSNSLRVRDLETREEWDVASQGRVWRGWPDDEGRGAMMLETPAQSTGWPTQQTSCECRWCNRFAMSMGFYGWGGPAFENIAVAGDGSRSAGSPSGDQYDIRGETTAGCSLEAAEDNGENLEHGPWRWMCNGD
ncbi:MAG: hypothetical protein DRJ42_01260 [Deltaproteobacteria bacterium]|nr:MAG: hypothetical protein DRJ42_01260 [Deltaproteobacteria bacterium]